jgi:hypothetical protein
LLSCQALIFRHYCIVMALANQGCQLAPVLKIMGIANTGEQRTRRCGAQYLSVPLTAGCDDLFWQTRDNTLSYSVDWPHESPDSWYHLS